MDAGDVDALLVALGVALALAALYVGVLCWFVSAQLLMPPHYAHRKPAEGLSMKGRPIDPVWLPYVSDPRTDFGLPFSEVEFTPVAHADHPKAPQPVLRGWHVPGRRVGPQHFVRGVVGAHGGGRDRREQLRMLPWLHEAGYDVLLFDYREHGISDGTGRGLDWGLDAYRDVLGAAQFARRMLHWERVCLLGASNGAVLSLLAGAMDEETSDASTRLVNAIAAECPYSSPRDGMTDILNSFVYTLHPVVRGLSLLPLLVPLIVELALFRLRHGDPLRRPNAAPRAAEDAAHVLRNQAVLLIHGTKDRRFPIEHSARILRAVPQDSKELWIVPDGRHTECYEAAQNEYRQRLLHFLDRSLAC